MSAPADVRIDESTWDSGTPLRKAEWRSACDDLLRETDFHAPFAGGYVLATLDHDRVLLEALDDDGKVSESFAVERASLAKPIDEYVAIIRRLDDNAQDRDGSWFEAVDMAKKVVHDEAARVLKKTVPGLSSDLGTLRKTFTLLLALFLDTTTMHHARGHGWRNRDLRG
ncbi:MAG TPA: UPF0262 family protein [Polyangiaceae bacterium]